jgi:hypothetical protein
MAHFAFARALNGNEAHSTSFIPDYADERALANDPAALVDHLDTLLASGQLTDTTKNNIVQTIEAIPLTNENIYRYDGPLDPDRYRRPDGDDVPRISRAALGDGHEYSRRHLLKGIGASALSAATLTTLGGAMRGFQTANAAEVTDYKALVCIFMWGGCDTHDVLLPYDQASYDQFRNIRSSLIGGYQGTRDRNQLLPISPTNAADFGGRQFAMPPEMSGLRGLFESGDMAFVANTGPLIRPLNRTQWRNGSVPVPKQLFSHNDQQSTWSASAPEGAQFGWGGRFADAVVNSGANINREFSTITAVGNELFLTGQDVLPYQIGLNGAPEIGLLDRLQQ